MLQKFLARFNNGQLIEYETATLMTLEEFTLCEVL